MQPALSRGHLPCSRQERAAAPLLSADERAGGVAVRVPGAGGMCLCVARKCHLFLALQNARPMLDGPLPAGAQARAGVRAGANVREIDRDGRCAPTLPDSERTCYSLVTDRKN